MSIFLIQFKHLPEPIKYLALSAAFTTWLSVNIHIAFFLPQTCNAESKALAKQTKEMPIECARAWQ